MEGQEIAHGGSNGFAMTELENQGLSFVRGLIKEIEALQGRPAAATGGSAMRELEDQGVGFVRGLMKEVAALQRRPVDALGGSAMRDLEDQGVGFVRGLTKEVAALRGRPADAACGAAMHDLEVQGIGFVRGLTKEVAALRGRPVDVVGGSAMRGLEDQGIGFVRGLMAELRAVQVPFLAPAPAFAYVPPGRAAGGGSPAPPSQPESNPPMWPPSVLVVEADDKFQGNKQALFDHLFTCGGRYSVHEWGAELPNTDRYGGYFNETGRDFDSGRTAVLLKPGAHRAKFNLGFYHSLIGLGRHPDAVDLEAFEVLNGVEADGVQRGQGPGALNNFWRSVENVRTAAGRNIYYFTSQASPLRKVHIQGQLRLSGAVGGGIFEWGYSSGGFMADSKVEGGIEFGSQQQFLTRNSEVPPPAVLAHGAWSNVTVGVLGKYEADPNARLRVTEVPETQSIAEKPYIMFEEPENRYYLMVPRPEVNKTGVAWELYLTDDSIDKIGFEHVYVADAEQSTAAVINGKLAEGKHVVFSPGIYRLSEPIVVNRSGAVLLGLGMATLMPADDAGWMDSAIFVDDGVENVRISALVLQAGPQGSDALLKWGTRKGSIGQRTGFLHDIFCRVGGDRGYSLPEVHADCMIKINSSNVVGDHLWLWRADHELPVNAGVKDSRNPVSHALVVNGDHVTMYGLFAEHALKDQVVWAGENGKTFFYQCELPYDVTQANFGDPGYVGYAVGRDVKEHQLEGAGVYSFFRDHDVRATSGFRAPEGVSGVRLKNLFSVFLNGKGGIDHVLNASGEKSDCESQGRPMYVC